MEAIMSSIDSSKPTIRRPRYPLSINAFLGPAFNACDDANHNSDQLDVDPSLLRYSRAAGSNDAFLSPSPESGLQHLYPSSFSSPLSPIENLSNPPSRSITPSPPAFKTPVKIREQLQEDVLVMDGFMLNTVAGNRARSSSDSNSSLGLSSNSLYKTEICRSWEELGTCRYGSKCQFAHGKEDMRPPVRHSKYKSEICKSFATTGGCTYGTRCRFVHQASTTTVTGVAKQEESCMSTARTTKEDQGSMPMGDESLEAFMDDIGVPYTSSDKEEEALMRNIVRAPCRKPRLPVFVEICPD